MNKKLITAGLLIAVVLIGGCVNQISEPKTMQPGLDYSGTISKLTFDSAKVVENAKTEGYAIRILKSPAGCRNPVPGGGCKGIDEIPPEYNYINVNQSSSHMDDAWESSPKWIAINGNNNIAIYFPLNGSMVHIISEADDWLIGIIPNKEMPTESVRRGAYNELEKLGIIFNGQKIRIVFSEGRTPERLVG